MAICIGCGGETPNPVFCEKCCDRMENIVFDRGPLCDWCSREIWADEGMVLIGEHVLHSYCDTAFGIFGGGDAYRMEVRVAR